MKRGGINHRQEFHNAKEAVLVLVINLGDLQDDHLVGLGRRDSLELDSLEDRETAVDRVLNDFGVSEALSRFAEHDLKRHFLPDSAATQDPAHLGVRRVFLGAEHDRPLRERGLLAFLGAPSEYNHFTHAG